MSLELGKRLTEFRKRNNLSQEELANKLKVSRQSICNWESGESSPSIDYIQDMAKLYNVSIDDLINVNKTIDDCYKKKEENGSFVHVSKKGIFINDKDGGDFLSIDEDGININGKKDWKKDDEKYDFVNDNGTWKVIYNENVKNRKIIKKTASLIDGLMALIVCAVYILLGCLDNSLWGKMWPLFFTFLIPGALVRTFGLKKFNDFPIVFIVAAIYCFLGMWLPNNSGWHPYWVIFFAIPIYYSLISSIKAIIKEKKKNAYLKDNVTISVDDEDDEEDKESDLDK